MKFKKTHLKPFGVLIEPCFLNEYIHHIDIQKLRQIFHQNQLIVLRGFNTFKNTKDFSDYCARWGEISLWPFGKVLELTQKQNPDDHIFDNSYVPLHWDGMYRPFVPEYQIFHCVDSPALNQGGETVFSNTVIALTKLDTQLVEDWKKILVRYSRKMKFYESVTVSPIITQHPYKNILVIRYNEPPSTNNSHFINPPKIEFINVEEYQRENIQYKLSEVLYAPSVFYAHVWKKNDVVIANNFTLLHGRNAFTSGAGRHLWRVHVSSLPAFKNPGLQEYK